jgi:hypothetical protein
MVSIIYLQGLREKITKMRVKYSAIKIQKPPERISLGGFTMVFFETSSHNPAHKLGVMLKCGFP